MIQLLRTTPKNIDFINLVKELDAYLKITDGEDHEFYNQYNGLENIPHSIVAYYKEEAIGCGAIKPFDNASIEIKRMYLKPEFRGKGTAEKIISELENWAKELGFTRTILETGDRQVEAVKFYHKVGYRITQNYGQYANVENSNCFEKIL